MTNPSSEEEFEASLTELFEKAYLRGVAENSQSADMLPDGKKFLASWKKEFRELSQKAVTVAELALLEKLKLESNGYGGDTAYHPAPFLVIPVADIDAEINQRKSPKSSDYPKATNCTCYHDATVHNEGCGYPFCPCKGVIA